MSPFTLSPSLANDLACPSRYVRIQRKEPVPGPFLATVLGKAVHRRIAEALEKGQQPDFSPFALPRRVVLLEGEGLEARLEMARKALENFAQDWQPHLQGAPEVRLRTRLEVDGFHYRLTGRVDLLGSTLYDWKTGSPRRSADQLRLYLFLARENGHLSERALAVGLLDGEVEEVVWEEGLRDWVRDWAAGVVRQLEEALAEPENRRPGPACRYCPFAHACPDYEGPARFLLDTLTGEVTDLIGSSPEPLLE